MGNSQWIGACATGWQIVRTAPSAGPATVCVAAPSAEVSYTVAPRWTPPTPTVPSQVVTRAGYWIEGEAGNPGGDGLPGGWRLGLTSLRWDRQSQVANFVIRTTGGNYLLDPSPCARGDAPRLRYLVSQALVSTAEFDAAGCRAWCKSADQALFFCSAIPGRTHAPW